MNWQPFRAQEDTQPTKPYRPRLVSILFLSSLSVFFSRRVLSPFLEDFLRVGLKPRPQDLSQDPGHGMCKGHQAPVLPKNRPTSRPARSRSGGEEAAVSKDSVMDSY